MYPYKVGNKIIIDPLIKPNELFFGKIRSDLYKKIGTVVKIKYMRNLRCNVYAIKFPSIEEEFWFKEKEIY